MKRSLLILALICLSSVAFSQTKMIISKINGTADSLLLTDIRSISFASSQQNRQILFQENFENGNLSPWLSRVTTPVITTSDYVSPSHALTLPPGRADYSCIYRQLSDTLKSGIVGIEFRMMKKDSTQRTAFYGMLFQKRSDVASYAKVQMAMGFGGSTQSDSVFAQTWNYATPNTTIFIKQIAKIQSNRWYKLGIEYNFATKVCTYLLDDTKIGEHTYDIAYFDSILFGDQDTDGADRGNVFFLDDIVVYRR